MTLKAFLNQGTSSMELITVCGTRQSIKKSLGVLDTLSSNGKLGKKLFLMEVGWQICLKGFQKAQVNWSVDHVTYEFLVLSTTFN